MRRFLTFTSGGSCLEKGQMNNCEPCYFSTFSSLFLPFLCRFVDIPITKGTEKNHYTRTFCSFTNKAPKLYTRLDLLLKKKKAKKQKNKKNQPRASSITTVKNSQRTLLRTLSLKWAAWYTIGIKSSLRPNSRTHHRTKPLWWTVINRAVQYSLKYITFFFFFFLSLLCNIRSAGGRLLEAFFGPLWFDWDSSEGLSKVSLFIFFTIPAMKPSRVLFQPSFFNDSLLLKESGLYRGRARPRHPLDSSL